MRNSHFFFWICIDLVFSHLEDCEHGESDVVEGSDASVWSGPLLQANWYIRVADVRPPPGQDDHDQDDGGGVDVDSVKDGTHGASEGLPMKQGAPISPSFTISSEDGDDNDDDGDDDDDEDDDDDDDNEYNIIIIIINIITIKK